MFLLFVNRGFRNILRNRPVENSDEETKKKKRTEEKRVRIDKSSENQWKCH